MTMGHRERLISGDEHEYLRRRSRRLHRPRPGQVRRVKAKFNRRVRRAARGIEVLA